MISFNGLSLDLPAIKIATLPRRHTYYAIGMKRQSFYKRHEAAIWLAAVSLATASYCLLFANNASLLWTASSWLMGYLP